MRRLPIPVTKRRAQLYTQEEIAERLGVSIDTVQRLERSPYPDLLDRYLSEIGWQLTFYPRRKPKKNSA